MEKVKQKVLSFDEMFKKLNDKDGKSLTSDMIKILVCNDYKNLYCHTMKFNSK
jgi:hypothetical protein